MKARWSTSIIAALACFNATAQTPRFTFGPTFGIGTSTFVDLAPNAMPGTSLQASVTAHWQLKDFFAVECAPATTMYSGYLELATQDGYGPGSVPIYYPYRDIYHIFSVEFPLLVEWRIGRGKLHGHCFFGSGVGFTMGGTHSKKYYDEAYNADNGYAGHAMREIADSYYLGILGAGIEYDLKKGVIGIDGRIQRTNSIAAFEGSKFAVRGMMIGVNFRRY